VDPILVKLAAVLPLVLVLETGKRARGWRVNPPVKWATMRRRIRLVTVPFFIFVYSPRYYLATEFSKIQNTILLLLFPGTS
jgi:hypothetical protein